MRAAIPVLLAGVLAGFFIFYMSDSILPRSGPSQRVPPRTAAQSQQTPQTSATTVTGLPATAMPASSTATPQPTPTATAIASTEGSPLNAARVIAALQGAGIGVSGSGSSFVAETGGAQQPFTLFVYPNAAELQRQWNTAGRTPQPRSGTPPPLAYWNVNAVLTFPDGYDGDLARRIGNVFLSLP